MFTVLTGSGVVLLLVASFLAVKWHEATVNPPDLLTHVCNLEMGLDGPPPACGFTNDAAPQSKTYAIATTVTTAASLGCLMTAFATYRYSQRHILIRSRSLRLPKK